MNVGNKVIYGLQTPKMFVNFNKSISSLCIYIHFPENGSLAQKGLKTPALMKGQCSL